jgi:hypothetical protein
VKAGAAQDKIESKGKGSLKSVYLSYLIISYLVGVNIDVQVCSNEVPYLFVYLAQGKKKEKVPYSNKSEKKKKKKRDKA